MSYPDYNQKSEDHQSMLILVRQIGQRTKSRHYNRTFDKITRCQCVRIQEPSQRFVWVRYKKEYHTDNNLWGDFQSHRKVLGLICIGKCDSEQELVALRRSYDYQCEQYSSTLVDSRLLVLGMDKTGHVTRRRRSSTGSGSESHDNTPTNSLTRTKTKGSPVKTENVLGPIEIKCTENSLTVPGALDMITTPTEEVLTVETSPLGRDDSGVSIDVTCVESKDEELEDEDEDEDMEEVQVPEKKYEPPKSPNFWFYSSTDDLLDIGDKMEEFVTSLFWVIEGKRRDRSFEKLDPLPLLTAPFEKRDMVGVDIEGRTYKKRCLGRLRKHLADLCLLAGLPGEAIYHYTTGLETLKSANDWLWIGGCYEGLCSASVAIHYPRSHKSSQPFQRGYQSYSAKRGINNKPQPGIFSSPNSNGLDLAVESLSKQCLAHDDIIDKYKEALTHYNKYRAASVIAMEASIKACRVLVLQKKNLVAADFLQNVVYFNLQLSEEEKIARYSTLSLLYGQIGFQRKAAFFKRVAAMQCVAPGNPRPGWSQCYNLLLQTLAGYKIPFDPRKFPHDHTSGWPVVQARVLHELVFSARKMGNPSVAIRHMTFLLHCMMEHLSEQEKTDISQVLENYTSKTEAQMTCIYLDSGLTLPPVHLTKLPTVRSFKPLDLAPHLRPVLMTSSQRQLANHSSPFIYSPLDSSKSHKNKEKTESNLRFDWAMNDVCEVLLQVSNPMPFELKVTNMTLITEGVVFESYPANLSLPADSGPFPVKLIGNPKSAGRLKLRGYSSHVLGIKTQCYLDDLPGQTQSEYIMQIVPSLPHLQVLTSLPQSACFSSVDDSANVITSAAISLYAGQSQECTVRLENIGSDVITAIDLSLDSRIGSEQLSRIFVWSADNLRSQLPLQPGGEASFTMYIHGLADFLPADKAIFDDSGSYLSPTGRPRRQAAANEAASSPDGGATGQSGSDEIILRTVESLLRVQYRGGDGGEAGYCRQCSVQFIVDIQSSLVFTRWDVLSSDSPDECYVVLDITNQTNHSIDITYTTNNQLHIPSKHIKRLAVRVGRCNSLPAPVTSQADTSYNRYQLELLSLQYSQYMAQFIHVRWTIASLGMEGRMAIDKLTWDLQQLYTIRTATLQWRVLLEGSVYEPETLVTCTVGEPLTLLTSITNCSDDALHDVSMTMTYSVDHVISQVTSSEDYVTNLSSLSSPPQKEVEPSQSQTLRSSLLFLCPGFYKVQVTCSSQPINGRITHTCYPIHIQARL